MKKTIENITERYENATNIEVENHLSEIKAAKDKLEKRKIIMNEFLSKSTELEKNLNKIGLTINKENICVGLNSISLRFISFKEKFKFVPFEGYTNSGSGKNRSKLVNKAEKISKIVENSTGLVCNINEFSLELNENQQKNNSVMCDLVFNIVDL